MKIRAIRIALLLAFVVAFLFNHEIYASDSTSISVYFNDEKLDPSVEPQIIGSRTFVPIRVIAEKWGAVVGWNKELQQVRITKGRLKIDLFIDQEEAFINGESIFSDAPPLIVEGRTMIPLRFVGELLGAEVSYHPATRTVYVALAKNEPPNESEVKEEEGNSPSQTPQRPLVDITLIDWSNDTLVIKSSGPIQPSVFYLYDPERIVMDFVGVRLNIDSEDVEFDPETYQSKLNVSDSELVESIRYAVHDPIKQQVRLVIDTKTRVDYKLQQDPQQVWTELHMKQGQYKVVIDAGHGGKDPGAKSVSGREEKDFNLTMALRVEQLLKEEPLIEPYMTRTTDIFLELEERTQFAEYHQVDAFISIHGNAFQPKTRGTETYYTHDYQREFAQTIHRHLVEATQFPDRGLHQKRFYVTNHTSMPAALVEIGFLTNVEEEKMLFDPEFQDRVAKALVNGIKDYFRL